MRKVFFLLMLLIGVSGCVSPRYGNFSGASGTVSQQMAQKTADQCVKILPPAQTQLAFTTPSDPFGRALIQALRQSGYALAVVNPQQASPPQAVTLKYVVDVIEGHYRVSLWVGQQSLSQIFKPATDGRVYCAGPWMRQEKA